MIKQTLECNFVFGYVQSVIMIVSFGTRNCPAE